MRRPLASFLLVLATCAPAGAAFAQDVNKKAMAQALFDQGLDLFDKGNFADACSRFEESQHLDPKLNTLFNEATCHDRIGKTASAWQEFVEASSLAEKSNDTSMAKSAHERASALGAKLSQLKLTKSGDTPGLTLELDGKAIDTGMFGAPLPLDPGKHHLDAKAKGYVTWSKDVDIPAGPAEVPLPVPALEKDTTVVEPPVGGPNPAPQPPAQQPEKPAKKPWSMPAAAIASFSIGGATLLTGIITGSVSIAMTKSLDAKCKSGCGQAQHGDLSTANSLANASNVTFAVTGAAVIVGVVVVATSLASSDEKHAAGKAGAVDVVSVGDVGAGLRVRF